MFLKLQHLDTNSFHKLCSSINTPTPNLGISISPQINSSELPIKKHDNHLSLENPNGGDVTKISRVNGTKPAHDRKNAFFNKINHRLVKNGRNNEGNVQIENKKGQVDKFRPGETVHTKCSTKWARYGGSIKAILEALETVSDLDEALWPWRESLSKKERTIILKEQSDWERALEIFEWFKRKGCYEVNVIHYNIMLRILGKARRWSEVERLWDEMGQKSVTPINSTYGTLIDVYSKGGRREKAIHWLVLMQKQGMEPDEVTMGIVVQMYKKAGEFRKAEQFFKNWSSEICLEDKGRTLATIEGAAGDHQAHVCLSPYTYNTLIDNYGKSGQLKKASETFSGMLRDGIAPTTVTFNTMIHILGNHGHLGEVASLIQKMEELRCLPDTRTYNILISLHTRDDNIELAAEYFKKMKEASLEPDIVSYRTLLYAFSIRHMVDEAEELISEMDERGLEIDEYTHSAITRMYIEAGMLEKSWLWFNRFHIDGNMTSECYSANIDAFGERGHILEAEKVFKCCQEKNKLSVLEFNVMIKAYGLNNRYDEACQLIDIMEERYGVVPDKISYNSLIQILASAELPHKAKLYLSKMLGAGAVSDCIPYCAVISSFIKLDQLDMAVDLFNEMVALNVQPDVVVYGVLINAFAEIGSVEEALGYVKAMRQAGLPMNAVIYSSLIKLYKKVGRLNEAQKAYRMLQSLDGGADVYSSNCMIDLYSERSMVKQAEEIFENLRIKGNANEFSYAMMLCMYKKVERYENALQIAQQMRELGILTDLLSYNHILGLYALDGNFKEAVETFREMIKAAVFPDDSTFRFLGVVLVKRGVPKQTVSNLEALWKKDNLSGLKEWTSTLYSMDAKVADDNELLIDY